jgi:hypothetical protein
MDPNLTGVGTRSEYALRLLLVINKKKKILINQLIDLFRVFLWLF